MPHADTPAIPKPYYIGAAVAEETITGSPSIDTGADLFCATLGFVNYAAACYPDDSFKAPVLNTANGTDNTITFWRALATHLLSCADELSRKTAPVTDITDDRISLEDYKRGGLS